MEHVSEIAVQVFQSDAFIALVVALILAVIGIIRKRQGDRANANSVALEAVEVGVRDTYEYYVRDLKQAAADGKLTESERLEAQRRALKRATDYAAAQGVVLTKVYTEEYLPVLIERVVGAFKGETKTAG